MQLVVDQNVIRLGDLLDIFFLGIVCYFDVVSVRLQVNIKRLPKSFIRY